MHINIYMQIHVNISKYILYVCVFYIGLHNKYSQYTHILYKQKCFLDAINHN